jgi:hypothetical protein
MKSLSKFLGMTALTGALLMAAGCVAYPNDYARNDRNYGPPPHTARHGYRQPYNGHEVRYDARLGVYLVVGMPNYFYLDNQYYRYDRNRWYYSQDVNTGWRDYDERKLPSGLAKKYTRKDQRQNRNKQNRKDKDRDY